MTQRTAVCQTLSAGNLLNSGHGWSVYPCSNNVQHAASPKVPTTSMDSPPVSTAAHRCLWSSPQISTFGQC